MCCTSGDLPAVRRGRCPKPSVELHLLTRAIMSAEERHRLIYKCVKACSVCVCLINTQVVLRFLNWHAYFHRYRLTRGQVTYHAGGQTTLGLPQDRFPIHFGNRSPPALPKRMALMLPTSLSRRHIESDNLAVSGQRQFGGEDVTGHSHWAASDLEGLL